MQRVAVVGASHKPERYSYKAMQRLHEHGHQPLAVAPGGREVLGQIAVADLQSISGPIDTVTMYLRPARQSDVIQQILMLRPQRVIFNPGTENPEVYGKLRDAGIEVEEACTLVLLATDQF